MYASAVPQVFGSILVPQEMFELKDVTKAGLQCLSVCGAGHVPMLADPAYCDLVQNIGVASLGADEKQIWHLTKLYWFTVEFGVVREGNQVKGFGAGVLSSYGELQHMASGQSLH